MERVSRPRRAGQAPPSAQLTFVHSGVAVTHSQAPGDWDPVAWRWGELGQVGGFPGTGMGEQWLGAELRLPAGFRASFVMQAWAPWRRSLLPQSQEVPLGVLWGWGEGPKAASWHLGCPASWVPFSGSLAPASQATLLPCFCLLTFQSNGAPGAAERKARPFSHSTGSALPLTTQ